MFDKNARVLDEYILVVYSFKTMTYMTPHDVIRHYGGEHRGAAEKAAEKLGLTRQTVSHWRKIGFVPLEWQSWIEKDTAGYLKADPRRPNDPHIRKNQ